MIGKELKLEFKDNEWPLEEITHDRNIARAIVFDDEGYFYFVRADRDDLFGKVTHIETPGGGVESGEDLEEAIRRELSEELGVDVEVLCKIGTVSDYYNVIKRHNISNYFLCRVKSWGDKHMTEAEINEFHLNTLKFTYEEAVNAYEDHKDSRIGRLIAQRELPILKRAQKLLNPDCGFLRPTKYFRFRTGAIVINDGNMLFVKSKAADYNYMIGGAVKMCETTETCIVRELEEESGMRATIDQLAIVCENFFNGNDGVIDGYDCHTIEFYYRMNVTPEELAKCKTVTDDGEELVWLPVNEIEKYNIKPTFIKERLSEFLNTKEIIHVIEERDR